MSPLAWGAIAALVLLLVLAGLFWRKTYTQLLATEHELMVTKDQLDLTKGQRDMFRRHSTVARDALPYLEMSSDSFYGFAQDKHKGNATMANVQTRAFEVERNNRLRALRDLLVRDLGPLPRIDES